jgi:GNAT superfamily N-acetyltransferase
VGWLAGFVRRRRLGGDHELIICDLEVAPAWRGFGLGRRLVEALRADLAGTGVRRASVLIDEAGLPSGFFQACGFHVPPGPQPAWLSVRLPGLSAHRAGRP